MNNFDFRDSRSCRRTRTASTLCFCTTIFNWPVQSHSLFIELLSSHTTRVTWLFPQEIILVGYTEKLGGVRTYDVDVNDGVIRWQARNSNDAFDWLWVVTWRERHLVCSSFGAVAYWAQPADSVQRYGMRQDEVSRYIDVTDEHSHLGQRKSADGDAAHRPRCSLDERGPPGRPRPARTPVWQSSSVVRARLARCQQWRTVVFHVKWDLRHRSWNE